MIVIDSGPGMDKDGALVSARKGATDLINSSPDGTNFAVVQAGDKADLRADMSTDKATLLTAINGSGGTGGIGPTKGSAVWSALNVAGSVLKQNKTLQPNVVLIVGDNDTVSPKDEPLGRNVVSSAGATIWVNQRLGFMDPAPYDALVAQVGGQTLATDNAGKVNELVTQSGSTILTKQYTVAYDSGLKAQEVSDIAMTVGGTTSTASFILGGVYQGNSAARPNVVSPAAASVFSNKGIFIVALVLVLARCGRRLRLCAHVVVRQGRPVRRAAALRRSLRRRWGRR